MKSLKMSFFFQLKLLSQLSMLLNEQYCIISVIEIIIFKLFYANEMINDSKIDFVNHSLSQILIKYFDNIYKTKIPLLLLQINKIILKIFIQFQKRFDDF